MRSKINWQAIGERLIEELNYVDQFFPSTLTEIEADFGDTTTSEEDLGKEIESRIRTAFK